MNHTWYARQFGERDGFAICISFGQDPHPLGCAERDATWGGLELWARGRCLTRNVSAEGGAVDEVRWTQLEMLRWLRTASVRMLNEEPLPLPARSNRVRDAAAWFDDTARPLLTLSEAEEDEHFAKRSAWAEHHLLRRAASDVALPHVVLRRLGDFVEVSWDNEAWGAPRPDLDFVEKRGVALISAAGAARVISEAVDVASRELAKRWPDVSFELGPIAEAPPDAWRWLVPAQASAVIESAPALAALKSRLDAHVGARRSGAYVPHSPETLVLRQAGLADASALQALLQSVAPGGGAAMSTALRGLMDPRPASTTRPWEDGYESASRVREALGWGSGPAPSLASWLSQQHVVVAAPDLVPAITLVTSRDAEGRGRAAVNPAAAQRRRLETAHATALGHLLFDVDDVAVDGAWEHWPTAARARAFGAMLLLPEDGLRETLAGVHEVDADAVRRVMARFQTGRDATVYHLRNLRFLPSDERRDELLRTLAV